MPNAVGFVDNSTQLAHHALLEKIKDLCAAAGWTVLRYDTVPANRELIMMAPGLSGTEQIFVGFHTYHDVAADYYNLAVAGFTGYVPGNSFDSQPGMFKSGIPAHNQRIDYWISVNGQRIALGLKVGTPVYEHAYAGFGLTRALPSQFPYPLVVGGMLNGVPATRFSDVAHVIPYPGARTNFRLRTNGGVWLQPALSWPWNTNLLPMRASGGIYPLLPILVMDANGIYCELDGVYVVSGFDNVTENTFAIGGVNYVVLQNVYRNTFWDYVALRLDA